MINDNAKERLIRRLNPLDRSHALVDEGTGELSIRPSAVALRKADLDSGLSVYQESELDKNGLEYADIIFGKFVGIAIIDADALEQVDEKLKWYSDPWPNGREDVPPQDCAHALIVPTEAESRNQKNKILAKMIPRFSAVIDLGRVPARDGQDWV